MNVSDQWLSVAQAATRLSVSERRVRQLLASGELSSAEVAGRQVLTVDSVRRREAERPPPGRPLSPDLAWAALGALNAVAEVGPARALRAAAPDRRVRWRLVRLFEAERQPSEWSALLRRRARSQRYYAHPALLCELLADRRVSPGRAGAAAAAGFDVAGGDDPFAYVSSEQLGQLVDDYGLEPDPHGTVELRVYAPQAADRVLVPGQPVPAGAAAADLLDSADARLRAAGSRWLQEALEALRRGAEAGS